MPKRMRREYLTLYSVERVYGGPEEGGWWYDWYTPKVSWTLPRNCTNAHYRKLVALMNRLHGWTSRYPRYSVLGGADAKVVCEQRRGQYETRGTMHYE